MQHCTVRSIEQRTGALHGVTAVQMEGLAWGLDSKWAVWLLPRLFCCLSTGLSVLWAEIIRISQKAFHSLCNFQIS